MQGIVSQSFDLGCSPDFMKYNSETNSLTNNLRNTHQISDQY